MFAKHLPLFSMQLLYPHLGGQGHRGALSMTPSVLSDLLWGLLGEPFSLVRPQALLEGHTTAHGWQWEPHASSRQTWSMTCRTAL